VINIKKAIIHLSRLRLPHKSRGAITVEYALGMMVAAFFMLGIFSLFQDMSVRIINKFIQYVISFPNI